MRDDVDVTVPNPYLKIVSREDWGAIPPKSTEPLQLPGERVLFMFTETERCLKKKECKKIVQDLQKEYMDKGMPDIPFSFIVGGDLRVYEGRGWKTKISRPDVEDWSDERIVIAYIGKSDANYEDVETMMDKGYELMYHGIDNQFLVPVKFHGEQSNIDDEVEAVKRAVNELKTRDPKEHAMKHERF